MAKYYGVGGLRKGKVGNEKYYLRNNKNFIQEAKKYIPINSNWLTKEEFKNYILSLLQQGIPQVYVLEQLPEEIYPDALIFVQNQQGTSVYVDKEGIRTKINIGGGGEGEDAVDIVNNIPEEPKNNTIYFVNNNANKESKIDKKELKDTPLECDIYVCDNNILRKIEVKGIDIPELPQIKQVVNDITTYSLKNIYNTNLTANKLLGTDANGIITTVEGGTTPHLYLHHFYYDKQGAGELNFVIYNTKSTSMSLVDIFNFLNSIGCNAEGKVYPASGNMANGSVVVGIYASTYGAGSLVQREFSGWFYQGSQWYSTRWSYFNFDEKETIIQIF